MSELQNPLFDEEKEFLERKKLEYERALRGDVDDIKEKSVVVGKVALVGAGLAGGIWLLTKAFGSKKRKKRAARRKEHDRREEESRRDEDDRDNEDFDTTHDRYTDSDESTKSAADSAKIFEEHHERQHEANDLSFGGGESEPMKQAVPVAFADQNLEADPFQDLPYDDSRRLPASHAFDEDDKEEHKAPTAASRSSRSRMIGSVLQSFLQSDTGKVLVAQAGALALAMVTKKVGEFFPATKNSDLAASSDQATAETGASPVASSAPTDSPDASNNTQYL